MRDSFIMVNKVSFVGVVWFLFSSEQSYKYFFPGRLEFLRSSSTFNFQDWQILVNFIIQFFEVR